jgi:DNA-binding response OmpR family regulator
MPRILIVEDDHGFRTMLETMVRLEGHEVHLAANGETGLAQARNKKPEIILSDLDMPGMNGIELVRQVRASTDLRHTYVILITGQGGQDAKLDALRAGADDFLEKPSSRQEILGRLEIAQKVMAVQQQQREAEARATTAEAASKKVLAELEAMEKAIALAEESVAKKNAAALGTAIQQAKEAVARARASGGTAAPAAGDSWL